ncbi:MAG: hypothetical protein ABEK10_02930 [Candidatus Nanosalina sp.]
MDISFRDLVFLVAGMFLGAGMITWGLADESTLPSKDKIKNWTEQYYQEEIVNEERAVINVYIENISESRFPSMYRAELVKESIEQKSRQNSTERIYISKDGLQTGRLEEIVLSRPEN